MHRTEGTNNVGNLFFNGPPGTVVEEDWLNAVQEEICYLIEQAGLTVLTSGTETRQQLKAAVAALIAVHAALTSTHGAVSAATANRIILRDASGRAQVAAPSVASDIATKNTVDTHAALTNPHSATSLATANRIILRDASGRAQVAAPSVASDIARKNEVDIVGGSLTTHAALTTAHSATAIPTVNRVPMYDWQADLVARLVRTEFTTTLQCTYFVGMQELGSGVNNYHRPMTITQALAALGLSSIVSDLSTHAALTNPHSATAMPTASRIVMYDSSGRVSTNSPSNSDDCVQYGQFGRSLAANGYQQLPGGLIIQWGSILVAGSSAVNVTLPVAYTVGHYQAYASWDDEVMETNIGVGASTVSLTQIRLQNADPDDQHIRWFSIGM